MTGPYGTAFAVLLLFTLLLVTLLPAYFRWEARRAAPLPEELPVLKEATRNFALAPDEEPGSDVLFRHGIEHWTDEELEGDSHE